MSKWDKKTINNAKSKAKTFQGKKPQEKDTL
jgi:hypothetical protein